MDTVKTEKYGQIHLGGKGSQERPSGEGDRAEA